MENLKISIIGSGLGGLALAQGLKNIISMLQFLNVKNAIV